MASRRTGILVVLAVLCAAQHRSTASPAERVAAQGRLSGMTDACRVRGLPAPCSMACSVSAKLCRACCAAVATFTTVPTAPGGPSSTPAPAPAPSPAVPNVSLPSDEEILAQGLNKSANCLALCSSFPAKRIRTILKDPAANDADLKALTQELTALNAELPWTTILSNANGRPASISVLCSNGQLSC